MAKTESYEDRIRDIVKMLDNKVSYELAESKCMDMKVSKFNEFEDACVIVSETGNDEGILDLVDQLIGA